MKDSRVRDKEGKFIVTDDPNKDAKDRMNVVHNEHGKILWKLLTK